jgi:hypothetical protein
MKYKVNVWKLLGKIAGMLIALLLLFYAFNVGSTVGDRVDVGVSGTSWLSKSERIVFVDDAQGTLLRASESAQEAFTYQIDNGYVLCFDEEDSLLLELVQLKENRMFSVRTNTMFYNEAIL